MEDVISEDKKVPNKRYKCVFEGCTLEFFKPSNLEWHMNVHLNQRPFKCTFEGCDKSYSSPSHLKRHALNHSNKAVLKKFRCKYCKGYFSTPSNLKRHIERTHSENAKVCEQCNKRFRKENLYEEHIIMFHNLQGHELKSYECGLCEKKLLDFRSFKKHKKKHLSVWYTCPVENCSAEFYTRAKLREHKKLTHVFQYTCADCNKIFYSKIYLKNHVLTHFEKRAMFPCTYENCDRLYYFKKNLSQHIRLYHLGKKFKCDICNIELSTKQKLDQHKTKIHKTRNKTDKNKKLIKKSKSNYSVVSDERVQ